MADVRSRRLKWSDMLEPNLKRGQQRSGLPDLNCIWRSASIEAFGYIIFQNSILLQFLL
jgi:hypothetical protein